MNHCVHGYDYPCVRGLSAVFSLCFEDVRRVTVELEPAPRRVVQARGLYNRARTAAELEIIARWLAATEPGRNRMI